MGESHVEHVGDVDVLVEGLLDEILGLVAGELGDPGVEEDEAEVEGGAEHEHVGVELELGDGRGRQRVAYRHQAHVLQLKPTGRR